MIIHSFGANRFLQVVVKRILTQDADDERSGCGAKRLRRPLDEPGEIENECGLDFIFGRGGRLRAARAAEQRQPEHESEK